jgi:hypothetical protein
MSCVGLISDTHTPERNAELPEALFDALRGADLIVHSGDVGELWVLDQLSAIAPVVAVHGNDDTEQAKRELPAQQIVPIAGQRVYVYHGHYPDREEELAQRKIDAWGPKLDRLAGLGAWVGASIVVFGHSHIPMAVQHHAAFLVNPGALASGSGFTRQRIKTVALMFILRHAPPLVVHVDLAAPDRVFVPEYDLDAGFAAARDKYNYQVSILAPELRARWSAIEPALMQVMFGDASAPHGRDIFRAYLSVAHRCWSGQQEFVTRDDLVMAIDALPDVPTNVKAEVIDLL